MENNLWREYKIYEWTFHDLKMYSCRSVKFKKKEYLGKYRVSGVYKAAVQASEGREFHTFSYNCKDLVKNFKFFLYFYR